MRIYLSLVLVFSVLLSPAPIFSQVGHEHTPHETLGSVTFNTSCSSATQTLFNRAVALMHSFQFAAAIEAFNSVLKTDPTCSTAYWGIALSSWGNPFAAGLKSPGQLEQGLAAVAHARVAPPKTDRERAYIEAVAHLYSTAANIDQQSRKLEYEKGMASLSAAYPDDTEAAIFYALSIAAAADPTDKTYANQLKAGAILEPLFARYPDHPGLAHYIIHAYDVPPLAGRAVLAAKRYSEIAPSTPHALHMPSHTFTRIGDWQDSIDANLASAAAAQSAGQPPDELHAADYLVYAYLQTAQDNAAKHWVELSRQIFSGFNPAVLIGGAGSPATAYFARAAIPARYCLERRAWADAAKLDAFASPYPYTDAITYFARGLGSAHLKDVAAARLAIDSLRESRAKLVTMKETYWANQVEIQRQEVTAWLAFAEGDSQAALSGMRSAAELEDKTEKNAITPGPIAPARELLGQLLLEVKQPSQALVEFEAALTMEPNRFLSLYGAAEAAKLAGNREASQKYLQKLFKTTEHADLPGREELTRVAH